MCRLISEKKNSIMTSSTAKSIEIDHKNKLKIIITILHSMCSWGLKVIKDLYEHLLFVL